MRVTQTWLVNPFFRLSTRQKLFNTNLKQIARADLKMYENVWDEISTNK